jgi:large subunit ribosomal protein L28
MLEWIERDAPEHARRRIPFSLCHKPMRDFVHNDRQYKDEEIKDRKGSLHESIPYGTMRITMAKECAITKKTSQMAGGYSTKVRATKFNPITPSRKYANLQKKRVYVPELGKTVNLVVSAKGLRTITKNGAFSALKKAGVIK